MKIAFVGFGNSVVRYHLPYLQRRINIQAKMIFRREEDRKGDLEREGLYPDIQFTSDLNSLLNDDEIQLVVINTPNEYHKFYAKKALYAGKHILVEKPFMLSSNDAKEIFALAKEKGLVACANQNRRFDADFLLLKKIVEDGKLGELIEVESHYDYFESRPVVTSNMLYNLGVHTIDQMVALFGIPKSIHCDVRGIVSADHGDDYFDLNFYYESGLRVSVKTSLFVKLKYPRFLVHGKKGSFLKYSQGHLYSKKQEEPIEAAFEIEPKDNWGTLSYLDEYGNDITINVPSEITDYGRVYDNLYDSILNYGEKAIKDEEVIAVLKIVEEALASIR